MRVTDTASFIIKSNIVHSNRYDYSQSVYTRQKDKLKIVCPNHGVFEQTPDKHIHGKGCAECAGNTRKDNSYFINRSVDVHGLRYDYTKSKYINRNKNVEIICRIHGIFLQTPFNHYAGKGCSECKNIESGDRCRKPFHKFVEDATRTHGDKYLYIESTYTIASKKMNIICKTHGVFSQTPNKHLMGQGCKTCFHESGEHLWSYSRYKERCENINNGKSTLYLIKCESNGEAFFKIGISVYGAITRFDRNSKMPYLFNILSEIEMDAESVLKKEKELHGLLLSHSYKPSLKFNGHTECFLELTQEVKDFFGVSHA